MCQVDCLESTGKENTFETKTSSSDQFNALTHTWGHPDGGTFCMVRHQLAQACVSTKADLEIPYTPRSEEFNLDLQVILT